MKNENNPAITIYAEWHEQIISSRIFADFVHKLPQSDVELAAMLNIEPSTIYRWRHGQNVPDIGTIVELALALEIAPEDAKILIRKARHTFGDEKHDYKLLKKLYREPTDEVTFDDEYECYADILDRDFHTALRRILTWRGLTQKQFAELYGVGKSSVADWLSGRRSPDTEKICTTLQLPQPIANILKKLF